MDLRVLILSVLCAAIFAENCPANETSVLFNSEGKESETRCLRYAILSTVDLSVPPRQVLQNIRIFDQSNLQQCIIQATSNCTDIHVVEQYILIGFAEQVKYAKSLEHCVERCLESAECSSGMFFHEDVDEMSCILNSAPRQDHLDLFVPEIQDKVTYFEPANCV